MFKLSIIGRVVEILKNTLNCGSDICVFIIILFSGFAVLLLFLLIHWIHINFLQKK
ncbi:conserved hypothetical protein [Methanohalobium evestigatum Z-7303]|uniref:Uncharacterized protein n=1 Tax=Methanohalobium evestigatum (strain ATCC BAA-1072 / DSM 3721 / NBRC 107634 / OCM 161 / Z-7303) TaxID=644295 RepID=D7EAQ8_METEZ|nr:hypothetical protein [Methanohalobium evestigatum]ADI75057.1 conserved hypothetical protein [Methanohalobium evestigatum Z-7303]